MEFFILLFDEAFVQKKEYREQSYCLLLLLRRKRIWMPVSLLFWSLNICYLIALLICFIVVLKSFFALVKVNILVSIIKLYKSSEREIRSSCVCDAINLDISLFNLIICFDIVLFVQFEDNFHNCLLKHCIVLHWVSQIRV